MSSKKQKETVKRVKTASRNWWISIHRVVEVSFDKYYRYSKNFTRDPV